MAAVKRLPVLHHSADYLFIYLFIHLFIFISFGIIKPIPVTLKIEYRLSQCYTGWNYYAAREGGSQWGTSEISNQ